MSNGANGTPKSNGSHSTNGTVIENPTIPIEQKLGTMVINDENATIKAEFQDVLDHIEKNENAKNGGKIKDPRLQPIPEGEATLYQNVGVTTLYQNVGHKLDAKSIQQQKGEWQQYKAKQKLKLDLANLDQEFDEQIEDIRQRYYMKLKPITDAINEKRRCQQNF